MSVLPRLPERFVSSAPSAPMVPFCGLHEPGGGDARSNPCGENPVRGLGLGSEESESAKSSVPFPSRVACLAPSLKVSFLHRLGRVQPLDRGCSKTKIPARTVQCRGPC